MKAAKLTPTSTINQTDLHQAKTPIGMKRPNKTYLSLMVCTSE